MWPKRSLDGCYGDGGVLTFAAGEVDLLAVQKVLFQAASSAYLAQFSHNQFCVTATSVARWSRYRR